MEAALLVLDPQNDFFDSDNPNLAAFQRAVPVINEAIALFREDQRPIAFIQHTSPNKAAGTYSWAIYQDFDCRPDDLQVSKRYPNAFWETDLDALLKAKDVDYVIVSGFMSERCVLSTLRGARERGYSGAVLQEGIASLNDAYTMMVLEISPRITLGETREKIEARSHVDE